MQISKFDGCWTISKGVIESGENPVLAAARELKEETNIDLLNKDFASLLPSTKATPLFTYKRGSNNIMVFLVEDEKGLITSVPLKCASPIATSMRHILHLNGAPEMDSFTWVTRQEAEKMVYKSQRFMFLPGALEQRLTEIGDAWR